MPNEAPYSLSSLDPLIHERARLGILSSLMPRSEGATFTDLRRLTGLTDGNLSRHIAALEVAGIVDVEKGFVGRRPQTTCSLTQEGRDRFSAYVAALERVVRGAGTATVSVGDVVAC